jgi:hypothetical protein
MKSDESSRAHSARIFESFVSLPRQGWWKRKTSAPIRSDRGLYRSSDFTHTADVDSTANPLDSGADREPNSDLVFT